MFKAAGNESALNSIYQVGDKCIIKDKECHFPVHAYQQVRMQELQQIQFNASNASKMIMY